MESRKMVLLNQFVGQKYKSDVEYGLMDTLWEGEGETN